MNTTHDIREKYIEVNGAKLHYYSKNQDAKNAVILLHGWMHSGARWKSLISSIPSDYYLIAPALPGFGKTAEFTEENISLAGYNISFTCTLSPLSISDREG